MKILYVALLAVALLETNAEPSQLSVKTCLKEACEKAKGGQKDELISALKDYGCNTDTCTFEKLKKEGDYKGDLGCSQTEDPKEIQMEYSGKDFAVAYRAKVGEPADCGEMNKNVMEIMKKFTAATEILDVPAVSVR